MNKEKIIGFIILISYNTSEYNLFTIGVCYEKSFYYIHVYSIYLSLLKDIKKVFPFLFLFL